jgi:hypothetical protein
VVAVVDDEQELRGGRGWVGIDDAFIAGSFAVVAPGRVDLQIR